MDGAVRCVEHGRAKYPDWEWRFYIGDSVPAKTTAALRDEGCQLVFMKGVPENYLSTFWRFYACEDSDVMISRDADSVILWREFHAVNEWLGSNRILHTMRDHRHHAIPILAGMWGVKGRIENIRSQIESFPKKNRKGIEQTFLTKRIWPVFRDQSIAHVGHRRCILYGDRVTTNGHRIKFINPNQAIELDFPTARIDTEHVGQVAPPESHNIYY
tara:strand:- start:2447 stop:3091 length:645 start_codon:yes stop_codon:yes gene_type:complete